MKYYTEEECIVALKETSLEINKRVSFSGFKWGFNDCGVLLALYDSYLRGGESKSYNQLDFDYSSTRDFLRKLYYDKGHTLPSYFEYCGYELLRGTRPRLGDVAFDTQAMICDGKHWVSVKEKTSEGVSKVRQTNFIERHFLIARPKRS